MTKILFSVILFSVGLSAFAQLLLKTGMSQPAITAKLAQTNWLQTLQAVFLNPYILAGFFMYGLGAVLWLWVLAKMELSAAYPFVGLSFLLTMFLGMGVLGETLTVTRVVGTILILSGCVLVARSV